MGRHAMAHVRTSPYHRRVRIECACGWSSTLTNRPDAQEEFFDHQHPKLTLDELMDRYGTTDEQGAAS